MGTKVNFGKGIKIYFILISFIFFISFAIADEASVQEFSVKEKSELCLNESVEIISEMQGAGFGIQKVSDLFKVANDLYEGQQALKENNRSYDFSNVLPYCEEIIKVREDAYLARDEFNALRKIYDESFSEGKINTSSVDVIIAEIENEIETERYEKVPVLIDKAYSEMVDVQARYTTLNVFYENTARGFKNFIKKNWIVLVSFFSLLVVLYLIYRTTISKIILRRKIEQFELRKKTLKEILQETQKEYFQDRKISEGTFNIKSKKIAEMIRDIDRQIPLLNEELAMIDKEKRIKNRRGKR
jgi:hypothetical protein